MYPHALFISVSYWNSKPELDHLTAAPSYISPSLSLTFDTPRENYNQDFEYRIEAHVTDSSRREIIASNNVRVTRQRYYVYARSEQNIYRPLDKVTFDIKALDANEQPVTTEARGDRLGRIAQGDDRWQGGRAGDRNEDIRPLRRWIAMSFSRRCDAANNQRVLARLQKMD